MPGRAHGSTSAAIAIATVLAWISPARAQPAARLVYEVPADHGCPDEAAFVDLVRARLGRSPFDPDAGDSLVVAIASEGSQIHGALRWIAVDRTERGQRRVDAARCVDVAEALAVAVSIVLEAIAEQEIAERELAEREIAERTAVTPPIAAPSPRAPEVLEAAPDAPESASDPPPIARSEPRVQLGAGAGIGFGIGPLPQTDFALFGALTWPEFALRVRAHYADTFAIGAVGTGYGLRTRIVRGALDACYRPRPFELCAAASAGLIEGEPSGVREPRTGGAPFGTLGANVGVTIMLGDRAGLQIAAELAAHLTRVSFVVGDAEQLWTAPPVLGQLTVSFLCEL